MPNSWEVLRLLMDNFRILNYGPKRKIFPGYEAIISIGIL